MRSTGLFARKSTWPPQSGGHRRFSGENRPRRGRNRWQLLGHYIRLDLEDRISAPRRRRGCNEACRLHAKISLRDLLSSAWWNSSVGIRVGLGQIFLAGGTTAWTLSRPQPEVSCTRRPMRQGDALVGIPVAVGHATASPRAGPAHFASCNMPALIAHRRFRRAAGTAPRTPVHAPGLLIFGLMLTMIPRALSSLWLDEGA